MKKKICVVTGTRAEYGLFLPLLKEIQKDRQLQLQIIATGSHLSPEFGLTYREIEKDGFVIQKKVDLHLTGDTEAGITKSVGTGIIGFAQAFAAVRPDLVVLLGDRFETFAAAVSAFLARIPIAHIHGGERTEGVIDDALRHAITKMSLLHFTAAEAYRRRVIQLGEDPGRVYTVGALGLDTVRQLSLLSREELERELGFAFGKRNVLVTFHPVTLEANTSGTQFRELLRALDAFTDLKILFTRPNADAHGRVIIRMIDSYVRSHPEKAVSYASMGSRRYLSTLQYIDAVIGNSSSGIIEVPMFGKPTVNIGDRQRGRLRAASVIDCAPNFGAISRAMKKAFSPTFAARCRNVKNPYGRGGAAPKIVACIKKHINRMDIKKSFYDLKVK